MPTPTYIPLATYTVTGSPVANVTFSSIPATYRDLIVIVAGTTSSDPEVPLIVLNADATASNYSRIVMYGLGSSTGSAASATNEIGSFGTARATWFGQLMDYSATDKHKTILYRQDKPDLIVAAGAFRWANTNAITSIKIDTTSNTWAVGSTFSLFGIEA